MKKKQRRVMVIMLGQRMTFRYNNFIIKFLVRYSENFLLRKADIILVNSEFSARVARNRTSNKIEIIVAKPGFELTPSAVEIKRHSDTPTRLLFVGECTKVKGLIYLIKAMSMMTDIELTLNIAGNYNIESAYYKKIITIVNRYHLNDVVNFLGFVDSDSLQNLYRKSTIYVMPSLSEGYGKSLAEAMSFGLPAVASNAGAIPEMVEDKVNAILVEPKNPEALADGIRQLARDGELRREMGRANLDKAGTFPTWDSFSMVLADQLVPVIKKLLNE
ncbi:MAG: glycosyltransferase family 4 protein [candidate division Zixibacteria bacterium]|nr:glycosyltransferase family 4 protein [candidate division Zixibacteria bacterium]